MSLPQHMPRRYIQRCWVWICSQGELKLKRDHAVYWKEHFGKSNARKLNWDSDWKIDEMFWFFVRSVPRLFLATRLMHLNKYQADCLDILFQRFMRWIQLQESQTFQQVMSTRPNISTMRDGFAQHILKTLMDLKWF